MLRSVQVDLDAIAHPQFAATSRLGFPIDMHAPVVHDGLGFAACDRHPRGFEKLQQIHELCMHVED